MKKYKWLRSFVGFLVMLNGSFIGLELYKESIRNQWASQQKLAHPAFLELEKLNYWTVYIEFTLSISILVVAVLLIVKKSHLVKCFIIVSASVQVLFWVIGLVLAMSFEIATIHFVQQLLGPSFILVVVAVYQTISCFINKLLNDKREVQPIKKCTPIINRCAFSLIFCLLILDTHHSSLLYRKLCHLHGFQ